MHNKDGFQCSIYVNDDAINVLLIMSYLSSRLLHISTTGMDVHSGEIQIAWKKKNMNLKFHNFQVLSSQKNIFSFL